MDFLKKAASDYLENQNGNKQNQGNQGQGNYPNQGQYGGPGGEGYGGQQQQQQNFQGQGGYGGNGGGESQGYYGGNQNQNQGGYGGEQNQGGYGGNQGGQNFGVTGGAEYNRPHGSGGSGGSGFAPNLDEGSAIQAANAHSGNGNENASFFSSALSMVQGFGKQDADDVDEDDVQRKHDEVYNKGNAGGVSANALGSAAALQAFKSFIGGGGAQQQQQQQQSGGNMQSKLIGMAMSEAAKMFDQSGGTASGNKQDAVNGAASMIMKLLIKSQFSGAATTGGANSGGLGQLMGLASKFM